MTTRRPSGPVVAPALDPLRARAASDPDRVALKALDLAWTFAELDRLADGLAVVLRERGVLPGQTVAARLPPGPASVLLVFAVPRAGAVLAPLDPRRTPSELERVLDALRPALLIAEDAVGLVGDAGRARRPRLPAGDEARARYTLWTSGTAGAPRGVRLRMEGLLAVARGSAERLALGPDDRWLASLQLAHVGGLALVVRAVALGSRLVVRPRFDPEEAATLIDAGEVTHASLVPVMLAKLLEAHPAPPPSTLRCLLIGGDRLPAERARAALDAGWPIALTYGLTEASSQVCTAPPALVARKPGAVGPPLRGVQLRIGEGGEIQVRGATVAEAELLADAVRIDGAAVGPTARPVAGADGWLATGDAGFLDDDGDLHVTGRLGDLIVTGGVNVDPEEVRAVLAGSGLVEEAMVLGVGDPEWGERVAALVTPEGVDLAALETYARERLSSPARPRLWAAVGTLPRNPNGKPDRAAARALLESTGDSVAEAG